MIGVIKDNLAMLRVSHSNGSSLAELPFIQLN